MDLIFCNKMDLPNAAQCSLVAERLQLNKIKQKWYIQPCSAIHNEGIYEGLSWLSNQIK